MQQNIQASFKFINLSRHIREIHGGVKRNEKTKQCEICNVDFANSSNYKRHQRQMHD